MKNRNVLAALTVVGLAAVTAVPAMALENTISGAFTSFYDLSNFSAGNGTPVNNAKTQNYFVERVRLGYTAKVNENAKLVTQFQMDYKFWGKDSYTTDSFNGGSAIGSRSFNIQSKRAYIDLNLPAAINTKIGIQGFDDAFKGIIVSADVAGIVLSHEYSKASVAAGFFRLGDSYSFYNNDGATTNTTNPTVGRNTYDMFVIDGKYNINKETKVGAAYYFIGDNRQSTATTTNDANISTLGINAEGVIGPVSLSGFALKQFGDYDNTNKAKGYAFNLGAKMPLAGGTIRSEFLYASGGANGKSLYIPSSPAGTEGGGFYDSELILLSRDKNATNFDTAIVYDVNNNSQGVIIGSIGYDYTFTPKLTGSVNAGFAAVAKDSGAHKSNYLGTEINTEVNYTIIPSVTIGARAGYLVLGDYFKTTPSIDNPYDLKLIAKLVF